jgi:hypothetical protein
MTETPALLSRPDVLAEVLQLIMSDCQERGWTIDAHRPIEHNPSRQFVAHIRDQHGTALGLGMSRQSIALAICEAFRSALAWPHPQSQGDEST